MSPSCKSLFEWDFNLSMDKVAFYNCEPSTLKDCAIEVAWAWLARSGEIFSESQFITLPSEGGVMDRCSASIATHETNMNQAIAEGTFTRCIAEQMNSDLEGYDLYSYSNFDKFWLAMIFDEVNLMQKFTVKHLGAFALIKDVGLSTGRANALENLISVMQFHRCPHAEWNAVLLAQLYRLALHQ